MTWELYNTHAGVAGMLIDTYKCKVHNAKIEILSFILMFYPHQAQSLGADQGIRQT